MIFKILFDISSILSYIYILYSMPQRKKNAQPLEKDSTINETKQIKYYFNEGKMSFERAKTTADYS